MKTSYNYSAVNREDLGGGRKSPKGRAKKRFVQSPQDSLMEELDKELDKRGYTGSPNDSTLSEKEVRKRNAREQFRRSGA